MGYILKNTSGLINTKITDAGRLKLAKGNFNIKYFQIGDSEVTYNALPDTYSPKNFNVLEPSFNAQNLAGYPQSNKHNIKYPYYVDGDEGNTYGIPYSDAIISPIYNQTPMRGFFTGNTTADTISWSAYTNSDYTINSNYIIDMSTLSGSNKVTIVYSGCNSDIVRMPSIGDFITIFYNGSGGHDCECETTPITPTPTPTMTPTPSNDPCALPMPTPTPSASPITPTPSASPTTPDLDCYMNLTSCYSMMTYRIVDICLDEVTLDRATPDFTYLSSNSCYARTIVYPPNMTSLYDSVTPTKHWNDDVVNYESICETDEFDVKIWNMNIPWSENPAGLIESGFKDYSTFGSIDYLGTKEYLGYASIDGQKDTSEVYYYDSVGGKVVVEPEEQKAIAIIHYTNQSIDFSYGEKFAFEPYDSSDPTNTTGQARNFKLHIPWLMWHKNPDCCNGQTFWVDPPNFNEGLELFQPNYIQSTKNDDMNKLGIRYYHLWDDNPNSNDEGRPNRVGKVFPDSHLVVIDDEELIAAMSYKSNRNWTLPAPETGLIVPNILTTGVGNGLLDNSDEYLYVTYRFTNSSGYTNSLHCNYYRKVEGPDKGCTPSLSSQDVTVSFGDEFGCLGIYNTPTIPTTTTTTTTTTICPDICDLHTGYLAEKFEIICQKVIGDERPDSSEWKIIDFTDQLSGSTIDGYLTPSGLTGTTFVITDSIYNAAPTYDLSSYVTLPTIGSSNDELNFGDEYYFYGSLETDIQATIYEMVYKINLGQSEFLRTSNPTWNTDPTVKPEPLHMTEIGLYDSEKDLMIISKLQSPILRQGIQQFSIKFDF